MTQYYFMPAGVSYKTSGGIAIYIRYEKSNHFRVLESNRYYKLIQTPDRVLMFSSLDHHAFKVMPHAAHFDECIVFAPFHPNSFDDFGFPYVMINYVESMGKEKHSPNNRPHVLGNRTQIVSDSGGFQLFQQRIDFINPYSYIEWCNENVNQAMIIDYPYSLDLENADDLARTQAKLTRVLLDNKRDDLELFNVFHGYDRDKKRRYRDIVEVDEIDRLAMGGMYTGSLLSSIDNFASLCLEGKRYKHYHILGVTNLVQLLPVMKLAVNEGLELVTSDSSTHIQKGINKDYFHFTSLLEPPRILNFGKPEPVSANRLLPCSCPVCSAVKYADVFNLCDGGNSLLMLMALHSMFNIRAYMDSAFEAVRTLSTPDLKEIISAHFRSKKAQATVKEIHSAIEFVDMVHAEGYSKARTAYKYYLGQPLFGQGAKSLLARGPDEPDPDIDYSAWADGVRQHVSGYIHTVDSMRVDNKEHIKNKDKKKKKHPGHSVKATRIPGKVRRKPRLSKTGA